MSNTELVNCIQCRGGQVSVSGGNITSACLLCTGTGMTEQIWMVPLKQNPKTKEFAENELIPIMVDTTRENTIKLHNAMFNHKNWVPVFGTQETLILSGLNLCPSDFVVARDMPYTVVTEMRARQLDPSKLGLSAKV